MVLFFDMYLSSISRGIHGRAWVTFFNGQARGAYPGNCTSVGVGGGDGQLVPE